MRVYISGGIKDVPNFRERFRDAEAALRAQGHDVVNPVTVGDLLEEELGRTPTYEEYMRADIIELLGCDRIFMLPWWDESKGAECEHTVAVMCGIEVMYG